MSRETRFPGLMVAAAVPPTLMIVTHNPILGAVTLSVVLTCWVLHARMVIRAEEARYTRILDYAQLSTNLGGNPAAVITALRQSVDPEDDLYRPETDDRPWVHLRPSDY